MTGHADGLITINIAEADDAERERRRNAMGEEYRTLLGHFRHEIGHYYWDRLIRDSAWIDDFRKLFGDEREDYAQALQRHHQQGPPADWEQSFVSAYASSHPWEDWAETWAHYLHMTDTLETAVESGLSLRPKRPDEPALKPDIAVVSRRPSPFDQLIERWFPLTYLLNNLNRGMGLPDAWSSVLPEPARSRSSGLSMRSSPEPSSTSIKVQGWAFGSSTVMPAAVAAAFVSWSAGNHRVTGLRPVF